MAKWFWYFVLYSFVGFVLEVLFARATGNPKRDRKCHLFLPLCPVYGLGAVLILLLPPAVLANPLLLFLCGSLVATAAEYAMAVVYHYAAGVDFWDYSHLPLQLGGRVCLLFSGLWGLLALGLMSLIQPWASVLLPTIPLWATLAAAVLVAADAVLTFYVLRRERSTEALRWYLRLGHGQKREQTS
ncbi:putative ABC transporter permease [Pseudoflavonifractor sp. CLA-AP-H29]|uniref:ABC transporter permease n=1 Tax=Pseudoflavonifractor intestinihominis TaxID=3133171 RepID=A0ABV1ECU4_9FIRM